MKYPDGNPARVGDVVTVSGKSGIVVCIIDDGVYSKAFPRDEWENLRHGVVVDFDAEGPVHYPEPQAGMSLVSRVIG